MFIWEKIAEKYLATANQTGNCLFGI